MCVQGERYSGSSSPTVGAACACNTKIHTPCVTPFGNYTAALTPSHLFFNCGHSLITCPFCLHLKHFGPFCSMGFGASPTFCLLVSLSPARYPLADLHKLCTHAHCTPLSSPRLTVGGGGGADRLSTPLPPNNVSAKAMALLKSISRASPRFPISLSTEKRSPRFPLSSSQYRLINAGE